MAVAQGTIGRVFEDDIGDNRGHHALNATLQNADNVRMLQAGKIATLAQKLVLILWSGEEDTEDFDGCDISHRHVLAKPDMSEAAAANTFDEAIIAKFFIGVLDHHSVSPNSRACHPVYASRFQD